jgi:glycosyltransferase involved in cell wall biosynthesis
MKVALVVKASNGTQERETRNMGYWSYPVLEFVWQHFVFGGKKAFATPMNSHYDLIFQEDAGPYYFKDVKKPIVYLAIDSTLSEDHLESRLKRAEHADLILVDMDSPERFTHLGKPVRRLNYCVNDWLFKDYELERVIDVSFYCGSNPLRGEIRNMLRDYCQANDIVFATGTLHPIQYARAMAQSKIVINWPRVPENRPHRVFDVMACGACLVTGPLPNVVGDERIEGRDYVEIRRYDNLPAVIEYLLKSGDWQQIATNGTRLVAQKHTWAIRAKQLRQIISEELGL